MSRGAKPQGNVKIKWSPNLAYAIGLLTADGSLSKDGRHIDLSSKDLEQVMNFRECLGLESKIGRKASGSSADKRFFRVQFGDILFYRWLTGIGLMPNKSKIIGSLRIPDKFFFDFLRGCFDGDGTIYAYWDPRWKSSYMFYLTFASASLVFLVWLQKTLNRLVSVRGKIGKGGRGVLHLRFAKAETSIIWNKMYHGESITYLTRKFTKGEKIFRINETHNAQVAKLEIRASSRG